MRNSLIEYNSRYPCIRKRLSDYGLFLDISFLFSVLMLKYCDIIIQEKSMFAVRDTGNYNKYSETWRHDNEGGHGMKIAIFL